MTGTWPRSFCRMLIQWWPCRGIGAATPGHSLSTYSSMVASVHRWQLVHSATSMIMFHFFMLSLRRHQLGLAQRPLDLLVLRHRGKRLRHVLDAAVPHLDLHQRLRAGKRVRGLGLGLVRRQQVE